MRRLGGIPVVRRTRGNLVAQAAERFAVETDLALVVPAYRRVALLRFVALLARMHFAG
jgi:hypothetical protein